MTGMIANMGEQGGAHAHLRERFMSMVQTDVTLVGVVLEFTALLDPDDSYDGCYG
jgi:hypothetical protein